MRQRDYIRCAYNAIMQKLMLNVRTKNLISLSLQLITKDSDSIWKKGLIFIIAKKRIS